MNVLAKILAKKTKSGYPRYGRFSPIEPKDFYARHGIYLRHSNWNMARCPFHDDKHASLSVNGEHGGFICHACGVKGSMIGFYMQYHHASYQDAIKAMGGVV